MHIQNSYCFHNEIFALDLIQDDDITDLQWKFDRMNFEEGAYDPHMYKDKELQIDQGQAVSCMWAGLLMLNYKNM